MSVFRWCLLLHIVLYSNNLWATENEEASNMVASQKVSIDKTFGSLHSFDSKILAEKRELMVHLPKDYPKAGVRYPVLYVLDGTHHFEHAVLAAENLHLGAKIPQVIIVGIPNNTGSRLRDAYHGRDNFITFISKEVKPFIDRKYNSSGRNILFGHSAMGLVTMTVFATSNNLFEQYIASSSAIDNTDTELFSQLEILFKQNPLLNKSIYFSAGEKKREGMGFKDGAIALAKLFTEKSPKNLTWHYDSFSNQNHTTAPYLAMFKGLGYVFKDYEAPALNSYKAFQKAGGITTISHFFAKRGEKYNESKAIPQSYLVTLAFYFMGEANFKPAEVLLKQHLGSYTNPVQIYGALGYLYEQTKDLPKALKAYQQALELTKPESQQIKNYYQSKVDELKQ